MLKLDETLNNWLLAVAIRYPNSLIVINKDLLDPFSIHLKKLLCKGSIS